VREERFDVVVIGTILPVAPIPIGNQIEVTSLTKNRLKSKKKDSRKKCSSSFLEGFPQEGADSLRKPADNQPKKN
jgi:hypothetical protein